MTPSKSGKSRADGVADELEAEILQQQLEVGTRLGLRTDLITRFDVSPGVVNEALRVLRERGLINVKPGPNGGVFVADLPPGVRLFELDLWFQGLSIEPMDIFESRVLLDDLFYSLALDRATREDLRGIERAVRAMEDATEEPAEFFKAIVEFHLAIAKASHVTVLAGLYESLAAILVNTLVRATFRDGQKENVEESVEAHRDLLDAIRAQDRTRLRAAVGRHRVGLVSPIEKGRLPASDHHPEDDRAAIRTG